MTQNLTTLIGGKTNNDNFLNFFILQALLPKVTPKLQNKIFELSKTTFALVSSSSISSSMAAGDDGAAGGEQEPGGGGAGQTGGRDSEQDGGG
jgi:hypothetical protein